MTPLLTTTPPYTIKKSVPGSRVDIWKALTDRDTMRKWYFPQLPDFRAEVGFMTEFILTHEERTFTHQWKVTEVEPLYKITYEWTFAEYHGRSATIFDISQTETGHEVAITNVVLEDCPTDVPEFTVESGIGGWEYFLGNLADYLSES